MCKYENVITRTPCSRFAEGLTHGLLGKPDVSLALEQHKGYVNALKSCGVNVIVLEPDENHPDSCFVEDAAIVTDRFAILASPCLPSRQGEETVIQPELENIYGKRIETIRKPGTLEGGDIIRAENHFFIGLSHRTNDAGGLQMAEILAKHGYACDFISIRKLNFLHLTTGMSYIGDNTIVCRPELADCPAFANYRRIVTTEAEVYAGNTVRMNDHVLVPAGFDDTIKKIEKAGFSVIPVPVSEIEKQDGGLSCLSLRIPRLAF